MKGNVCQGIGSLVAADAVRMCSGWQKTEAWVYEISVHIRKSVDNFVVSSLLPQGSNSGHEAHTDSVSARWSSSTALVVLLNDFIKCVGFQMTASQSWIALHTVMHSYTFQILAYLWINLSAYQRHIYMTVLDHLGV